MGNFSACPRVLSLRIRRSAATMRDHLDDEQLSESADRERAGVPHPPDIASHLATCDTCPERVRDTLVVIDALRCHGRVAAPRVFAVPEATGVLLRPIVPAWTS